MAVVEAGTSAAPAPRRPAAERFPGGPYFLVVCRFSHRSHDDPIVFPGQAGRSHNHTFIGNRSTDAFSTPASLQATPTSCGLRADTSAYWVPTLFADGNPVTPLVALIHYVKRTREHVRAFPAGLKMIAGNAASRRAQSVRVTYWSCGALDGRRRWSSVPNCSENEFLNLHVDFPGCWDGRRLDSPDHRSHMAYPANAQCPASHPVAVPTISLVVLYPAAGPAARLSSGLFSGHADFVNAWDEEALTSLVGALNY